MGIFRRHRKERKVSYSKWDGTQSGFDVSAAQLMEAMGDDLMYHGDLNNALRHMMQDGFDIDGDRVQGLRDLMERVQQRRQELLDSGDLGGVYDEIASDLREVVEMERSTLDDQSNDAKASGDDRRSELTDAATQEKQFHLDMLPDDLAGRVKSLQQYDFASQEAQERFDELVERLREQLMQQFVDQMADGVDAMSEADMARVKDMMAALNEMLEQRAGGEEPDFEGFMERFGDFFPENPQTLDELLEIMAQRMAAMQAMLNSMTPEQRQQLADLNTQLMQDMDLQWQAQQLGQNLQQAFPDAGWERSHDFGGFDPLNMSQALDAIDQLGDLDQLDNMLQSATNPGALAEIDIDRARDLLGDDVARSLEQMAQMAKALEEAGLIENREGKLEMTPRAIRQLGKQALNEVFKNMDGNRFGGHQLSRIGVGHERDYSTKPYEFGDPFNLHIEKTIQNAIRRTGGGTPVNLTPDDFEIERTEMVTDASTILMLDLSLSMPMRENFLPAKKVAMALHSLMTSQFPRDYFGVVSFSEVARVLKPEELPEVSWDYVYGTNMQHAFRLSRQLLSKQRGTKQIIMITDGEPTAHILPNGSPYFAYPPSRETVELTLNEVAACTRDQIRINTFMLDATPHLTSFIEKITEMNGGRAFFTTNQNIGEYLLVDFVEHRRAMVTR